MLTMSQINDIRDLSQKGYSISKISSLTGLDRKTVRKYLNQDDFSPQPPVAKRRTSIVTPCKSSACPRQKHVIQGLYVNWREPIFSLPRGGCGRFLGPELSNSKTASILHWTQTS